MEAFRTEGTCARQILFTVDKNDILIDVKFLGGCAGGLQALCRLVTNMPITKVIEICKGIKCKNDTSCPDQLACALHEFMVNREVEKNSTPTTPRGHPSVLPIYYGSEKVKDE